jgi:phosphatidylinositol-4,5-bisphosphate 4-phosphatase
MDIENSEHVASVEESSSDYSETALIAPNFASSDVDDTARNLDFGIDPDALVGVRAEGVSIGKVYGMKKFWYLAALDLLEVLKKPLEEASSYDNLKDTYTAQLEQCRTFESQFKYRPNQSPSYRVIATHRLEEHFPVSLPKLIYSEIANACGMSNESVKTMLRNCYIRQLNRQEWKPIRKTIKFKGVLYIRYISTIMPVNQHFHATYGPNGKKYGTTGLCSMSTSKRLVHTQKMPIIPFQEMSRTTNLAYTELRRDDTILFAGFRSGSLSGKGYGENYTKDNAHELLEAMAIKYSEFQKILKQFKSMDQKSMRVISINLQSSGIGKEGNQIEAQKQALKNFIGREIIVYPSWQLGKQAGKPVTIKVENVICVNLGVNAQGDRVAADIEDIAQLVDWLVNNEDTYLQQGDPDGDLRLELLDKVRLKKRETQLFSQKGIANSYKLASRLAMLGFLSGHMVHFNCKSGKDRTGLMDCETKFLAYRIDHALRADQRPIVPRHTLKLDWEKRHFQQMLFESGNLEMQAYNTGGQGFKIAPADGILIPDKQLRERLGGKQVLTELQGLKRYTNIDKI